MYGLKPQNNHKTTYQK